MNNIFGSILPPGLKETFSEENISKFKGALRDFAMEVDNINAIVELNKARLDHIENKIDRIYDLIAEIAKILHGSTKESM